VPLKSRPHRAGDDTRDVHAVHSYPGTCLFRAGVIEWGNADQRSGRECRLRHDVPTYRPGQHTSDDFTGPLKRHGVMIRMDGKGRCIDNIFVERLWRSGVASNTKLMLHLAQRCLESTHYLGWCVFVNFCAKRAARCDERPALHRAVPTLAGTQPDG
jgi:hypothetical protein